MYLEEPEEEFTEHFNRRVSEVNRNTKKRTTIKHEISTVRRRGELRSIAFSVVSNVNNWQQGGTADEDEGRYSRRTLVGGHMWQIGTPKLWSTPALLTHTLKQGLAVRFPTDKKDSTFLLSVQTCSEAHTPSYSKGIGNKAARAWSWPLIASSAEVENEWS